MGNVGLDGRRRCLEQLFHRLGTVVPIRWNDCFNTLEQLCQLRAVAGEDGCPWASILEHVAVEEVFGGVAILGKELLDAALFVLVEQLLSPQAAVEVAAAVQDAHHPDVYLVIVLHAHLVEEMLAGAGHAVEFGLLIHDALAVLQRRGVDGVAIVAGVAELPVGQPVDAGFSLGATFEKADGRMGTKFHDGFVILHVLLFLR